MASLFVPCRPSTNHGQPMVGHGWLPGHGWAFRGPAPGPALAPVPALALASVPEPASVLGLGSALWVLGLRYNKQTRAGRLQLNTVEKHAVIETSHSGNISDIWLQPASDFLLSAAEDCKVKIWSFKVILSARHLPLHLP